MYEYIIWIRGNKGIEYLVDSFHMENITCDNPDEAKVFDSINNAKRYLKDLGIEKSGIVDKSILRDLILYKDKVNRVRELVNKELNNL